ncbi:right-handed parallel beta-helix repeat-containing protein [Alteromonas oceanisediminis]|uniref:right-handed parallel beta-helix repeat-containing protein n=1 Tax=Alteromonas oceanisediminis TaxID=2836180 RepID=UPI001BDA636D|nr:right-handed parallel beta-helix repeat-containing protein [Alteromonas oceanisediminis]MBT0585668.1 right-handed parallel beta-helix repeat-containing protein [Alteromonas oceanisediminis]
MKAINKIQPIMTSVVLLSLATAVQADVQSRIENACAEFNDTTNAANHTQWQVVPNAEAQSGGGTSQVTLSEALSNAKPGDYILLAGGNYHQPVSISRSGLTLKGPSSGQPARIAVPYDNKSIPFTVKIAAGVRCTTLENLQLSGGYFYTVSAESGWPSTDPSRSSRNIIIRNNEISYSGRDTIKIKPYVANVLIESNHIHTSGRRDGSNAEGIDIVNGHHISIMQNRITNTATTGVYAKGGASSVVIARNYLANIRGSGILMGFDTSPQFFNLEQNPQMFEIRDSVAEFNILDDVAFAGIGVYAAQQVRVNANTLLNVANRAQSAILFGISYQDNANNAQRPASENIVIENNIVATPRGRFVNIRYDNKAGLSSLNGMPFMLNNAFASEQQARFSDNRPATTKYTGQLQQWLQHIHAEQLPEDDASILLDQSLSDAFELPSTIPVIQISASSAKDFCLQMAGQNGVTLGAVYSINTGSASEPCANAAVNY